ncbi:MAG: hypothetical protein ABI836_03485 [Gemmatimonadota bacterium]
MILKKLRGLLPASWVLLAAATVTSCGSGVDGVYHDSTGQVTLELKSGGKAHITLMGEQHDLTYKIEGNKIAMRDPTDSTSGEVVATRNTDGTLAFAMWTLSRKK